MKAIGTQMLQTNRLILRRFMESDAEAMFQNWASSAEHLTYVTWNPHPDVEVTCFLCQSQLLQMSHLPQRKPRASDRRYQHR